MIKVEYVIRFFGGLGGFIGVKYFGVVVIIDNGDCWLVYKGLGYGKLSKFYL